MERIAGKTYGANDKDDISIRVITDHIRSCTFMVSDGILPSNEGRGYVLRRLLRRAARHGRMLGISRPFLVELVETVIQSSESAYPELREHDAYIKKVIGTEEANFARTIDAGMNILNTMIDGLEKAHEHLLKGLDVFKLNDTFGFPIDLTRELCEERGITVDEEGYKALMEKQRSTAREATARNVGDVAWVEDVLKGVKGGEDFVGYESLTAESEILGIVYEGERVEAIGEGDAAQIVLTRTPFYAEMGGQVGDSGTITCGENVFTVTDTRKSGSGHFIHVGTVTHGTFQMGDTVTAAVDENRRMSIMRNHTACHLLQKALQEVLGDHVHQAGSLVDDKVCRFDFSHFSAVTPEELEKVEARVNELILEANPVTTTEMPIEEAKKMGAMALFGEKYGDTVRVVNANNKSIELCGGTHVDNTAKLGLFKILKESSVAAGIRRIEAVTGRGVLEYMAENQALMNTAAQNLKLGSPAELPQKTAQVMAELKAKEKALSDLENKMAASAAADLFKNAVTVKGLQVVTGMPGEMKPDALRLMIDEARGNHPDAVIALGSVFGGKGTIAVACGTEAVKAGVNAGKLVRALCQLTGGNGGGRPDSAMGGAGDPEKIAEALTHLPELI